MKVLSADFLPRRFWNPWGAHRVLQGGEHGESLDSARGGLLRLAERRLHASRMGADALLYPWKRPVAAAPSLAHQDIVFVSEGLRLRGWLFRTPLARRGLVVYLHGISDNRQSGIGVAQRFLAKGYDVLVYDSRAHGESEGKMCTYGFHEKRDVSAALDAVKARDAILFGSSLGAAVALRPRPRSLASGA